MGTDPTTIRNVALVGHAGAGKTTLAEAMLFRAGVISRLGRVEDGTTVTDTEPEEHSRTHSVRLSVAPTVFEGHLVNIIDTPGEADFREEALAGMRVADLAVFVIDATAGVHAHDVLLWRDAQTMGLPRMVFVNKMDRSRASFDRAVAHVREQLGDGFELVEIPIGEEASFHGVADLLSEHAYLYDTGRGVQSADLPPEIVDTEHAAHETLVEDVVETEESLLEAYLSGHEPTVSELERALHDGVDAGEVFPVMVGSALGQDRAGNPCPIGVDRLLHFICHVGPAPRDLSGTAVRVGEEPFQVPADPTGPLLVAVFATRSDSYVGQITLLKVLSGTLRTDDVLVSSRTHEKARMHGLLAMRGGEMVPTPIVEAGDVCAIAKLGDVQTGDLFGEGDRGWTLILPDPPPAVYGLGLRAATAKDEDKMATALHKIVAEDRSLQVQRNDETHQTVLWGTGDAHVQVAIDRMRRRHKVEVDTEPVKIAYRETITRTVQVEGRHKKQSGGRGQFGVAVVRFEPLSPGEGFQFESEVVGGAIPKGLIPAVGAGIEEAMGRGGLHGHPLVDLRAVVTDGRHHAVDSDEMSFRLAGATALAEALPSAGVTLLEPIAQVEITVPAELQGDVMGDLQQRRGRVEGTRQSQRDEVVILASAPEAMMRRYAIDLRSLTGGRARFTTRHDRYEPTRPEFLVRD